jgi:RNA polymerase sigma-70 factor, ECF subfamily
MNEQDRHNLFSELMNRHQSELYGYIYAVVRNWEDADDLFQAVCLVLWTKFELFRPGTSFFAWARQTAKITVSNFLKTKPRRNYVSEQMFDTLTEIAAEVPSDQTEPYLILLRQCRAKLGAADDGLLELRYVEDLGSREIADRVARSQQSVCQSLKRIRRWLLTCIRTELARQERPTRGLP